ncbi:MAG: hypothetical protein Q8R30_01765 [bacterium]|nr:hypothetical protein [bacterium]MDZ4285356.1 hypothetical protein [Candidatus Sungbacteria bacterium]
MNILHYLHKKWINRHALVVVAGICIVLSVGALYAAGRIPMWRGNGTPQEFVVELREDGFHPQELTIQKGDSIKFVTTRNSYFWPASDLHPTHLLYSGFDPKEPIGAKESWTFRFEKPGGWKFHDHLAPYFTGIITVTDKEEQALSQDECLNKEGSFECWRQRLLATLHDNGVDAMFDLLAQLYKEQGKFDLSCHGLTHDMGLAAYKVFLKNNDSVFTPKVSFCAYGFYHGFMEAFLRTTGDVMKAREFCGFVQERLADQAPDAGLQCFHGIGHGLMDVVVSDKRRWGNEHALVAPALEQCEKASEKPEQLYRCASGVFNGIANFYISGQFKLSVRKDDPLWLCNEQPERYKDSCYGNMNSTVFWLGKNDFSRAVPFVEKITEDTYAISAMRYLAGLATLNTAEQEKLSDAISICRGLRTALRAPCIEGFAHGFLEHGTPTTEYAEALSFCRLSEMKEDEREICFHYVLSGLHGWYSAAKAGEICGGVEERYRKYCSGGSS